VVVFEICMRKHGQRDMVMAVLHDPTWQKVNLQRRWCIFTRDNFMINTTDAVM